MGILTRTLLTVAVLALLAAQAASQQIRGPVEGSLPAGERRLNRSVSFRTHGTTSVPMSAEPRTKARRYPEFSPGDQPPPSAPAGTNYCVDSSAPARGSEVPPLILESFQGAPQTSYFPPDPVIAAGPRHLLVAVNEEFRILTREGKLIEAIDAGAWYDAVLPGCRPFDPRVQYDHFAGRFMMLWLQQEDRPASSHYLLSVSDSEDPTGQWVSWAFPGDVDGSTPSETWADNACLGFDSSAVYLVSNQFTFEKWDPVDVRIRIIPKQQLMTEGDFVRWTDFSITGAFSIRPSVVHDHSDSYYLLEAVNPTPIATAVRLYRLDNPTAVPSLTSTPVPVAAYGRAMNAGQAGGGELLDVRRSYIQSEVQLRNGSLHAVFPIKNPASPNYSALRYLCINTATSTTSQDITFGSPGQWYFFPAVAVNRDEDVAITFARSGIDEHPGTHFTWRSASDGPALRPSVPIQPGWAHYQRLDGFGANRWGDYSGAAVDPVDETTFWLMGDYADGPNIWGAWVNAVRLEPYQVPRLIVERRIVDLGVTGVYEPPIQARMTVRNGGIPDLTISALSCTFPFAVVDPPPLPARLGVYDSLTLTVSFTARDTVHVAGELTIVSNDAVNPVQTVSLRGSGIVHGGTAAGVIYAWKEERSGGVFHLLDWSGSITASIGLESVDLRALSVGPWDGRLYGAARDNHGTSIVKIDGATGGVYRSYSLALHGVDAVCAAGPDTFYCGTDSGGVYRFVPSTEEFSLVASRKGVGFSGFAQSSSPHRLWASARAPVTNDTLYLIDALAGSIVPVGTTGFMVGTESVCRASDGGLLGLVGSALVRVDTLTGKGSVHTLVALDGLRAIAEGLPVTDVARADSWRGRRAFALEQNYPNPFNPSTTIGYSLPLRSHVVLAVFNTLGQKVSTLVEGDQGAGYHEVVFDAAGFPSGVYLCRLQARPQDGAIGPDAGSGAGSFAQARKLLLLR